MCGRHLDLSSVSHSPAAQGEVDVESAYVYGVWYICVQGMVHIWMGYGTYVYRHDTYVYGLRYLCVQGM